MTRAHLTGAHRQGLSFIEVLVASSIMVVVMLPLFLVFSQSVRTTQVSIEELQANLLAQEVLDQIAMMGLGGDRNEGTSFAALQDHPLPNPPPSFPRWATLPATGMAFDPPRAGSTQAIDTRGWSLTGYPYPGEEASPLLAPHQRLFLSPLPDGFSREVKVHPAIRVLQDGAVDPDLIEVEVRIRWKDRFLGNPEQTREVVMRSLVPNPDLSGGMP